jgi:hypothetical protein
LHGVGGVGAGDNAAREATDHELMAAHKARERRALVASTGLNEAQQLKIGQFLGETLHVPTPNRVYSGQLPSRPVASGTMPIKPNIVCGPTKTRLSRPAPATTRTARSMVCSFRGSSLSIIVMACPPNRVSVWKEARLSAEDSRDLQI